MHDRYRGVTPWKTGLQGSTLASTVLAVVALASTGSAGAQGPARAADQRAIERVVDATVSLAPGHGLALAPSTERRIRSSLGRALAAQSVGPVPEGHAVVTPGTAECSPGAVRYWPVNSAGHSATVTWTHVFYATQPDFSDAAVEPSPWLLFQVGADFWHVETFGQHEANGPKPWPVTFITRNFAVGSYAAVVNLAIYFDGDAISGAETFLLSTSGPNAISPVTCQL